MNELIQKILKAGIIGAGGAGFPSYFKLKSKAEIIIGNGAECEPLLYSDKWLLENRAKEIIEGILIVKEILSAKQAVIALKAKYKKSVDIIEKVAKDKGIKVFELDNFYPAGDEQVLVYEVTNRIIPEGGIPINVGIVVNNIATLYQIYRAVNYSEPVTKRIVTVTGEVEKPLIVECAIGTPIKYLVDLAVPKLNSYAIIDGGPMMGRLIEIDSYVNKTTSGIIMLPPDHPIVKNRKLDITIELNRDYSVCCNCSDCTFICPRYHLGHRLEPHKIMQGLIFKNPDIMMSAWLCCECGACEYACPMGLSPRKINQYLKDNLRKSGIKNTMKSKPESVRRQREWMKLPTDRVIQRFRLSEYNYHNFEFLEYNPDRVRIYIDQHIGDLPVIKYKIGDSVNKGNIIAEGKGELTSFYHASIDGVIHNIGKNFIDIRGE